MTIYKMSLQKIIYHGGSCYDVSCEDCPFGAGGSRARRGSHCGGYERELLEDAKLELIKLELDDLLREKV